MTSANSAEPVIFSAGRPCLVQVLLEQDAPGVLGVLPRLLLEPLADLVARPGGLHQRQPVAGGAALALGGEDLHDVARAQLVVQRDDLAVDLGADAAVADVGVDLVGEVQRGRARRQRLDLPLGREHEDLVLEEVDLQRLHELLGIGEVLLPVQKRAQPLELVLPADGGRCARDLALLVHPVRRHAELGHVVHLPGADLDLQRPSFGPITVVCSAWYMLNLGIATKSLKRPGSGFQSEWMTPTAP